MMIALLIEILFLNGWSSILICSGLSQKNKIKGMIVIYIL